MHLVYDKNYIAQRLYLIDKPLHARFKLTAKLRSRHKCSEVHEENLLITELVGYLAAGYFLRQCLGYCRLSDARLTYETRVVLLAARENLHHALRLALSAYHGIKLTLASARRQILAVKRKKFSCGLLRLLFAVLGILCAARRALCALLSPCSERRNTAEKLGEIYRRRSALGFFGAVGNFPAIAARDERVHFIFHIIYIFVADTHILEYIVHLSYAEFFGTAQTKPLLNGFPVFEFCYKDDRRPLVTA